MIDKLTSSMEDSQIIKISVCSGHINITGYEDNEHIFMCAVPCRHSEVVYQLLDDLGFDYSHWEDYTQLVGSLSGAAIYNREGPVLF